MKMVHAVIRPCRLDMVKEALVEAEFDGMTILEAGGFGKQKGEVVHCKFLKKIMHRKTIQPISKIKIEIAVDDEDTELAMMAISRAAHTGKIGDGLVYVTELETAVRIRTGERDSAAMSWQAIL